MEIKVTRPSKARVNAEFVVPAENMKKHFDYTVEEYAPEVKVAGFRPGLAPKSMIIAQVGQARIMNGAVEHAIRESFNNLIKQEKILPVESPKVSIDQFPKDDFSNDLKFKVEVDITPEVEVGDYKKIKLDKIKPESEEVTDDEVEKTLEYLRGQNAEFKPVERGAKDGDRVEISFSGAVKGVEKDSLKSQHHPLVLGNKSILPEIEEKIGGMKTGETKEFEVKLPKEFRDKELAGQSAKFKLTTDKIDEVILPELNDELAVKFGQKDMAVLKSQIKDSLEQEKKQRNRQVVENELAKGLLKITKVDLPESLVTSEVTRLKTELEGRLAAQNMTLPMYVETLKLKPEEFDKTLKEQAENNIKLGLTMAEIAKRENVKLEKTGDLKSVMDKLFELNQKGN